MDSMKKDFKDKEEGFSILDTAMGIALILVVFLTIYVSFIQISNI